MSKPQPILDPIGNVEFGRQLLLALPTEKKTALQQGEALAIPGVNYGVLPSLQHISWLCVALAKTYPSHVPSVYQVEADLSVLVTMLDKPWPVLVDSLARMKQAKLLKKILQAMRKKWRDINAKKKQFQPESISEDLAHAFQSFTKNLSREKKSDLSATKDMWALASAGNDSSSEEAADDENEGDAEMIDDDDGPENAAAGSGDVDAAVQRTLMLLSSAASMVGGGAMEISDDEVAAVQQHVAEPAVHQMLVAPSVDGSPDDGSDTVAHIPVKFAGPACDYNETQLLLPDEQIYPPPLPDDDDVHSSLVEELVVPSADEQIYPPPLLENDDVHSSLVEELVVPSADEQIYPPPLLENDEVHSSFVDEHVVPAVEQPSVGKGQGCSFQDLGLVEEGAEEELLDDDPLVDPPAEIPPLSKKLKKDVLAKCFAYTLMYVDFMSKL
jgi:hypothetical protein